MKPEISKSTVVFGPFETDHFRDGAGPEVQEWFLAQVRDEILPQMTGPVTSVSGHVYSRYDKPRHLGPNSVVKDFYEFTLSFRSAEETETVMGNFDRRRTISYAIDNLAQRECAKADKKRRNEEDCRSADPDITAGDPAFADWTGPDLAVAGAKSLELGVEFGPFETDHFRSQADTAFRENFLKYVRSSVMPMIKGDHPLVRGRLLASFDDTRHLGPNSALKFRYHFELIFSSHEGEQVVSGTVNYIPNTGAFTTGNRPLTYEGFARRRDYHEERLIMERIAFRYRHGQRKIICPRCNSHLIDLETLGAGGPELVKTRLCARLPPICFSEDLMN